MNENIYENKNIFSAYNYSSKLKKFRKLEKEIPIYTVLPYCVIATYEDAQLIDCIPQPSSAIPIRNSVFNLPY